MPPLFSFSCTGRRLPQVAHRSLSRKENRMPAAPPFRYRVIDGWLRDLAAEPTPNAAWPCTRWDDAVARDQIRFLDFQAELNVDCNVVWGLFVDRNWPVPFQNVISDDRAARLA